MNKNKNIKVSENNFKTTFKHVGSDFVHISQTERWTKLLSKGFIKVAKTF
jgi:hypothetical protein